MHCVGRSVDKLDRYSMCYRSTISTIKSSITEHIMSQCVTWSNELVQFQVAAGVATLQVKQCVPICPYMSLLSTVHPEELDTITKCNGNRCIYEQSLCCGNIHVNRDLIKMCARQPLHAHACAAVMPFIIIIIIYWVDQEPPLYHCISGHEWCHWLSVVITRSTTNRPLQWWQLYQ